eukprot:m.46540 g.46540  ORF g.46540 m.46540 type:complete len:254 (-) comp10931_c0_seq2:56-817(-)
MALAIEKFTCDVGAAFLSKSVVVTGGTKGIGRALCVALSDLGASVTAVGRSGFESLKQQCPEIKCLEVDLSDTKATQEAFETLTDVDHLVNNAGMTDSATLLDQDISVFEKVQTVNATAALVATQHCAKDMIGRGIKGSIVNVSSQASAVGLPNHTAYCASKGALDQLTRVMAAELGPQGIRVNSVNPTVVMTEMGRKAWSDPDKSAAMLERIPLKRFAEEEDVVNAILFLLSDKASMIHGAFLPVDGGFWAV